MDKNRKAGITEKELINVNEADEINYWTDKFDITKAKLRAAVNAAGPSVKDVEAYLIRNR